ncbi:glycosyltransferase family 2 protein [Janibacter anophelis]|uniref:glycosyltransferase family 2 protein n=1 Tax=Janibacter anophelis TaxID=319054 RepID=UPI0013B067F2|nr:glycosyltransferase family A protein [Janibacter anophelis]
MDTPHIPSSARRVVGGAVRKVERRVGRQIIPRELLGRRPSKGETQPTRAAKAPKQPTAPTAPGAAPTPSAVQAAGTWSGQPRTSVRAAVIADDRFAHLLAPEWLQTRPSPGRELGADLDLLLVQLDTDGVPGWDERAAAATVRAAVEAGVPVTVWATAAGPVPAWLEHCTGVLASDEAAFAALTDAGASVTRVAPFVQPLTQGPAGNSESSSRRARRIGIVLDHRATFDDESLREVYAPALERMPRREVAMVATHEEHSPLVLPEGLPDRIQAVGPWADLGGSVRAVTAVMDLSGTSPWAPWTSLAAGMGGTPLVGATGPTGALPQDIAALVPRAETAFDLRTDLGARMRQTELSRREGHLLLRSIVRSHTAGHRVRDLLAPSGIALSAPERTVSAIVPTNRTHELGNVFTNLGRQEDVDVELVLVLHGLTTAHDELRAAAAEAGVQNLVIVEADASLTLGACMNLGVDAASGRYVAKMDDDNYYGPQFLADLVDSFEYSSAGITGKWCHYVWLSSSRAVVLRFPEHEHRFGNRVQGGAMLFRSEVVRHLRFSDIPRRVDSDILDRAHAEGIGIYSADPYNFVSVRGADRHAHTWTVGDSVFLTDTGDLRFFGDPREHVTL